MENLTEIEVGAKRRTEYLMYRYGLKDGGIIYSEMVAAIKKATRQLQRRVDALEEENKRLRGLEVPRIDRRL